MFCLASKQASTGPQTIQVLFSGGDLEGSKKCSFFGGERESAMRSEWSVQLGDLNGGADRWPTPTHARTRAQVGLWDVGSTYAGPRKSVNLRLFSSFFFIAAYAKSVFLYTSSWIESLVLKTIRVWIYVIIILSGSLPWAVWTNLCFQVTTALMAKVSQVDCSNRYQSWRSFYSWTVNSGLKECQRRTSRNDAGSFGKCFRRL